MLQVDLFLVIGFNGFDDTGKDLTGGTVDGDVIAFAQDDIGVDDAEEVLGFADADAFATGDTGQAEAARYHGGMAGRTTTGGQNTFRDQHTMNVIGAGFGANQDDGGTCFAQFFGAVGVEDGFAAGGTGGGVEALCQQAALFAALFLLLLVEARQEQLIDLGGIGAFDGFLLGNQALGDHIDQRLSRRRAALRLPERVWSM